MDNLNSSISKCKCYDGFLVPRIFPFHVASFYIPQLSVIIGRCSKDVLRVGTESSIPDPPLVLVFQLLQ